MSASSGPGWRRLAAGSLLLVGVRVGGMGCGLLLMVFLARTLSPADLGGVTLCFSTAMIGGLLTSLNVGAGAVRFITAYTHSGEGRLVHGYLTFGRRTVLATATVVWTVLALVGAAGLALNTQPLSPPIIVGLALAPLFAWLRIAAANVAATGEVVRGALPATLLRPLLLLASVMITFLLVGKLHSADVLVAYAATLIAVIVLQAVLFRPALAPLSLAPPAEPVDHAKLWRSVGVSLLIPALFLELFVDIVVLFAALVVTDAELGALGIVLRVQGIVLFLVTSINMTMSPRIAAAHSAGDRAEVNRLLLISTHLKLWPSLLALGFLVLFGHYVLAVFSSAYSQYQATLVILSTTPLIMAIGGPVVLFVTILGLEQAARRAFGASLVLLFALIVTLGSGLGLKGIGLAVVLVWIVWHLWLYVTIRKDSGYSTVRLRAV